MESWSVWVSPTELLPLSSVVPDCSCLFWCYHRIANEQVLITDVMRCGTEQQSLLPKHVFEFHWACEVNSKQVILQMVLSSRHCYLDLFFFCFLFKMLYECHMLFWAGTNIQGFHHHCHCHNLKESLSWITFFHSLLGKWLYEFYSCWFSPCKVPVLERNCGLKKLWQTFRFYTHQIIS